MKRRRPPRAWIGSTVPVDPSELSGPRGLIAEVLSGEDENENLNSRGSAPPPDSDRSKGVGHPNDSAAFHWSLLTPARQARILAVVDARLASVTVVLDRLLDPHNTAAILRTAEGLGLGRVHVVSHESEDGIAHRRVTQDAHKWLDLEQHASGATGAEALRARGFEVWAGHLDDKACLYTELPADRPVALLFGNEHEGPSERTLAACTGTFRIPMAGFTQSFNVSVAAGMALAQVARARREALGRPGDLSQGERVVLKKRFTLLAAKLARRLQKGPR
jgi:tRNA (guanosine-2'-O-)-methyltransferase